MKRHRLAMEPGLTRGQEALFAHLVEDFDTTESLMARGVDIFAFDGGPYCNGPRCVDCGTAKCHHHHKQWWKEECNA